MAAVRTHDILSAHKRHTLCRHTTYCLHTQGILSAFTQHTVCRHKSYCLPISQSCQNAPLISAASKNNNMNDRVDPAVYSLNRLAFSVPANCLWCLLRGSLDAAGSCAITLWPAATCGPRACEHTASRPRKNAICMSSAMITPPPPNCYIKLQPILGGSGLSLDCGVELILRSSTWCHNWYLVQLVVSRYCRLSARSGQTVRMGCEGGAARLRLHTSSQFNASPTERPQTAQNGPVSQHNVLRPMFTYETFIWTFRKLTL